MNSKVANIVARNGNKESTLEITLNEVDNYVNAKNIIEHAILVTQAEIIGNLAQIRSVLA